MAFCFRASLTRGIVFEIPGTVTRLPRGQRRRNLRKKTRHCSRNTSMSRKRRKSDHHTAACGWKFFFLFCSESRPPLDLLTVLLLYCKRSGVAERRLHMSAVFCCGCWWLCCVRCCSFCVLQVLLCRVLSLLLTFKISQTCSLVYTVNIRKITTLLLQQIRYTLCCQTLCTKRDKTEPPAPVTTQKHKAEIIWKDVLPQEKKTGNMYSSTDTHREPMLLLKCRSQQKMKQTTERSKTTWKRTKDTHTQKKTRIYQT